LSFYANQDLNTYFASAIFVNKVSAFENSLIIVSYSIRVAELQKTGGGDDDYNNYNNNLYIII